MVVSINGATSKSSISRWLDGIFPLTKTIQPGCLHDYMETTNFAPPGFSDRQSHVPGSFELNQSVAQLRRDWSSHFGLEDSSTNEG